MDNLNDNEEWITLKKAADILGVKHAVSVKHHIDKGRFRSRRVGKTWQVNKEDVIAYHKNRQGKIPYTSWGDIVLDWDESMKPIESFQNPNSIVSPVRYRSISKYAVTNKGRVFNLTLCHELAQSEATGTYLQVEIFSPVKRQLVRVHVLVAFMWCQNAKLKECVHHIDGNKQNNVSDNLVWMTAAEHKKAHHLFDYAKEHDLWDGYNAYIKQIQKENEWDKEYRCVIFEKDNCTVFSWIDKTAYDDYKSGKRTLDEIPYNKCLNNVVVRKELL